MNFPRKIPIIDIAQEFDLKILGDETLEVAGINEFHKVRHGDLCFVDHPKYYNKTLQSDASVILINESYPVPTGKALLVGPDPFYVYNTLVLRHRPHRYLKQGISQDAIVDPSAIIEDNVTIGPDVTVGANTVIQSGVTIYEHCHIGARCLIQCGTVIGTDAFYFKKINGKYVKWRSGGMVVLEDNVDIGANCTINRGVSGDTIIGEGSKLDCLVHVAHGAVIGKNCLIAAQVGIAGKSIIGDNVTLYGQVGVAHGLNIADNTTVYAQSGVAKDLDSGTYFGSPAKDARAMMKELSLRGQLPDLVQSLRELKKKRE